MLFSVCDSHLYYQILWSLSITWIHPFLLAFLWIIHHDVPIHCMVVHVLNRAPHQILWIKEYPQLEGTHKDHWVQLLAPHSTTQNSNPMSESGVQTLLELQQLEAIPTALGSLFRAHHPLVQTLSLTPFPAPPLTQLHAVPSGPVAVTQSRAQRCPPLPVRSCSRHEASPQLLCSALRKPSHPSQTKPFLIFVAVLWMLSNSFMSLNCAAQNCSQCWRCGCTRAGQSLPFTE